MNPLSPLPGPPNDLEASLPCAMVWSRLKLHQRANIQRVMLQVCCQLASVRHAVGSPESPTLPAPSDPEVAHERA